MINLLQFNPVFHKVWWEDPRPGIAANPSFTLVFSYPPSLLHWQEWNSQNPPPQTVHHPEGQNNTGLGLLQTLHPTVHWPLHLEISLHTLASPSMTIHHLWESNWGSSTLARLRPLTACRVHRICSKPASIGFTAPVQHICARSEIFCGNMCFRTRIWNKIRYRCLSLCDSRFCSLSKH